MSIFAKRLYMSKREKEYKMNKIKDDIENLDQRILRSRIINDYWDDAIKWHDILERNRS